LDQAVFYISEQLEEGSLLRKALEEPVAVDGSGSFAFRGFRRPSNGSQLYTELEESTLQHARDNIATFGVEKRPHQPIYFSSRDPRFALSYAIPFTEMDGLLIVSRERGMLATIERPATVHDGITFKSLHVGTILLRSF